MFGWVLSRCTRIIFTRTGEARNDYADGLMVPLPFYYEINLDLTSQPVKSRLILIRRVCVEWRENENRTEGVKKYYYAAQVVENLINRVDKHLKRFLHSTSTQSCCWNAGSISSSGQELVTYEPCFCHFLHWVPWLFGQGRHTCLSHCPPHCPLTDQWLNTI